MAFNDNQNESPLPIPGSNNRKSENLLPKFFRTDVNRKFLGSTLDQLITPGVVEKINSYVGRKTAKRNDSTATENYLADISKDREDYQFEPAVVGTDLLGNVTFYKDYNDYIGQLKNFQAPATNHSKMNSQEFYVWNPNIDFDKFTNFREYYWLPTGPQSVPVFGQARAIESTYTVKTVVEDDNVAYVMTPNGFTRNPKLKLYRGQKYTFEIDAVGHGFALATTRTFLDTDPTSVNDLGENVSTLYKKGVVSDTDFVEKGTFEFTVPDDAPDALYYVSQTDINTSGMFFIQDITENTSIDVENEILGKKTYKTSNGFYLSNGMKVYFQGIVTPEKYSIGNWYVDGVGDAIRLVQESDLEVPTQFTVDTIVPFDSAKFDTYPFENATGFASVKDYIVINRTSADKNPWSRYNKWFHKSVIELSAEINNQPVVIDQDARAKRPIIEFNAGLKLYNFGSKAKETVDLVDTFTKDVFSSVEGSDGYNVDNVQLSDGMRVLFTADPDPMVNGKIYTVKFLTHTGRTFITLLETSDTVPYEDETVLVRLGDTYKGASLFYKNGAWRITQVKSTVNQHPLFDLFDASGYSFSDNIIYTSNTFQGNRVFGYKIGTGTADTELGFPLSYQNISNIGDILFNFDLLSNTFSYQKNGVDTVLSTDIGFLKKYDYTGDSFKYTSGWTKAAEPSYQYVIRQHDADGITKTYPIDVYDKSGLLTDLQVKVYVNTKFKKESVDYNFETVNDIKYIVFVNAPNLGDSIVIKTESDADKNANGYYEIPVNFERNPSNENITAFTLGEVNDHVNSIVEDLAGFSGVYPGSSNLRDLGDYNKYGKKFLQHSGPVTLPLYHITDKTANVVHAIRSARYDYGKFKKTFLKIATDSGFYGSIPDHVDHILSTINFDKTESMPYYTSDMVPFNAGSKTSYVVTDLTNSYYPLEQSFSLDSLSSTATLVYLNGRQLLVGNDYEFIDGFVNIKTQLAENDVLEVFYYSNTNGCFIPQTPSKLGLYPAYVPSIFMDNTYTTPALVVQGHDGSISLAYNDYRDELLLELETRIYNNIKVKYDTSIVDIHEFVGNKFRNTGFSDDEINSVLITDYSSWLVGIGSPAYNVDDFWNLNNAFSYNYKNSTDTSNAPISGYWRKIYVELFDTDRPHSHPWEMFGYSIKPTWWESTYGPAPYTKDNLILWNDVEQGMIRIPGSTPVKNQKYARPGILGYLPVNESGDLISPYESGYAQQLIAFKSNIKFQFGDRAPVENAWRKSSEYPFALLAAWTILQPAKIMGLGFDRANTVRDNSGNISYNVTKKRINFSDFVFPTRQNNSTGGIVNYIFDYLTDNTTRYSDYIDQIKSLNTQLSFKIGGYAEKNKFKLVLDSRTPLNKGNVFVPNENYSIFLNKSSVLETATYSGVIVEKTKDGYVVTGYDPENPVFKYNAAIPRSNDNTVVVGGISEGYVEWNALKEYVIGKIVKYNNIFYRVTVTHTSSSTFDVAKFAKLADLPLVGGARVTIRKQFDSESSYMLYGTVLPTLQDVVDFMLGYQYNLKNSGFKFEYFNNDTQVIEDWLLASKEFAFWTTQNWDYGSVITLSPCANRLIFEKPYYVVDNMHDPFYNYKILKSDGSPLDKKVVNTVRDNSNQFSLVVRPASNDGIYFVKLPLVQKEHVVIIDNKTVFNDVIYDTVPGYRQERILVVGYRTDNWNGSLNIPGFIYDQAKTTIWQTWTDYSIGDVVKYKEFYYSASVQHNSGSEFDSTNWNILADRPEKQLKPNWDYKANQITDFYNLETDNFDSEQQRLGQHLTGYQKRQYLENIITDDVSQYKFYQGFIQEKGTLNSFTKLFDALSGSDKDSLEFYEEWALRVGQYGALDTFEEVEFVIDESKFRLEPQTIELVNFVDSSRTDLVYQIAKSDMYYAPATYNNKPFPASYKSDTFTKSAGYVNMDHVNHVVSSYSDILKLNVADVEIGEYVWVLSEKQDWNVYVHNKKDYHITKITQNYPGYTITFNKNVDIKDDQIFGIYGNSTILDGFYIASKVSLNTIVISNDNDLSTLEFNDSSVAVISIFEKRRFSDFSDVNDKLKSEYYLDIGKIWVDSATNGKWGVYENIKKFAEMQSITPIEQYSNSDFGKSIAVDNNNSFIAVGAPNANNGNGSVLIYARSGELSTPTLIQIIDKDSSLGQDSTKFGYSVEFSEDGRYLFVGTPYASNIQTRYVGELDPVGEYAEGDVVSDRGTLWRALTAISGDNSTITDLSNDWEPAYTIDVPSDSSGYESGLTNQGAITMYQRDLTTGRYLIVKTIVSPTPDNNEMFGFGIKVRTNSNTLKLFVGAPGSSTGRIYFINYENEILQYTIDRAYKGTYSSSSEYNVRDIVYYDGVLYSAKTNVSSESFNSTKWIVVDATVDYTGFVPSISNSLDSDTPDTNIINSSKVGTTFDVNKTGTVLLLSGEIDTTNGVTRSTSIYRLHNTRFVYSQNITSGDILENFGVAVAINSDGTKIAIGASKNDVMGLNSGAVYVYRQSNGEFALEQTLYSPSMDENEMFGIGIQFAGTRLIVSSVSGDYKQQTLFDENTTIFDNNSTVFVSTIGDIGKVYSYEQIGNYFVFADLLDIEISHSYNVGSFKASQNHVYVPFSKYLDGGIIGKVIDFRTPINENSWSVVAEPVDTVDLTTIKRVYLYNSITSDLILDLDYIDPRSGKIAGPADQEIDFKTFYDPAVYSYNSSTNLVVVDADSGWTEQYVGKVWWDLTNAIWMNPYQGNTQYRISNWNTLVKNGSIDVYEWVESDLKPSEWDRLSDTTTGLARGISGSSLYGDSTYVTKPVYNDSNNQIYNLYYFWVKNKKTVPTNRGRTLSIDSITNFIENPSTIGYRYIAFIGNDRFAMYNCKSLIKDKDVVLHVSYYTNDVKDGNVHNEYQLVTENLKISSPAVEIENKWIDSLIGYDTNRSAVPDPKLPYKNRYGTLTTPRQGWFINRVQALTQVIDRINLVLIGANVVDTSDMSGLFTVDEKPLEVTGMYDVSIDSYSQLKFVGVAKTIKAEFSPIIENGKIVSVIVTNPGRGYKNAPKLTIEGSSGSGAILEAYIDSVLGKITSVEVIKTGKNYSDDTKLDVRKFSALVTSDETADGRWSIFEWNSSNKSWNRTNIQSYDTTKFWNYADWYATGYNKSTKISHSINYTYQLAGLDATIGDIILVNTVGSGGWSLLEKTSNTGSVDYTVDYRTVGRENGTIQLSSNLYNFSKGASGFDAGIYDISSYDREPIIELRKILETVKTSLFTGDLEVEWNNLFFSSIRYVLSEQNDVDWVFKTSFVRAKHNYGTLYQSLTFKNDNLASYEEYVGEAKPYSTKIREYISSYDSIDNTSSGVYDFDNPPKYNPLTGFIENSNEIYSKNEIGNVSYLTDSIWLTNQGYKILEIKVVEGGSGYTERPVIVIGDGTVKATAYMKRDTIGSIEIESNDIKFLKAPTVYISGSLSKNGTPAKAVAILGDGLTRSLTVKMLFDRIAKETTYADLETVETFTGSGAKESYVLKWPADAVQTSTHITINGNESLRDEYSISNIIDVSKGYTRHLGIVTFVEAPAVDSIIVINYTKNIELLSAADRVTLFYKPTSAMPGVDLAQVMSGIEYSGVNVDSIGFGNNQGFGAGGYGNVPWDTYDSLYDDKIFKLTDSTTVLELSAPLESGVVYNLYKNNVRLDDINFLDSTGAQTNPNAVIPSIIGDGSTTSIILDPNIIPTHAGDVIVIRKSTSDGSFAPNNSSYDSILDGGNTTYTTATGIASSDIIVDGDGFVTPTTSKGPEELVPGQIVDALDIRVYNRQTTGCGIVASAFYTMRDDVTTYAIPGKPVKSEAIFVKINNAILDGSMYVIDYPTSTVDITGSYQENAMLTVSTIGASGENIVDTDRFVYNAAITNYELPVRYSSDLSVVVSLNGRILIQNTEITVEKAHNLNIKLTFGANLAKTGDIVDYIVVSGSTDSLSQVTIDNTFVSNGSNVIHRFNGTTNPVPHNSLPVSHKVLVKVDDNILRAGYNKTFVSTGSLTYHLDEWQFENKFEVDASFIMVYVDGIQIDKTLYNWNVITFNLSMINDTIAKAGAIVEIYALPGSEYYFVNTRVEITDAQHALIDLDTLLANYDEIKLISSDSTTFEATKVSTHGNNLTLESYVKGLNEAAKADPAFRLEYGTHSMVVTVELVTYVTSNTLTFDVAPTSVQEVSIYQFSNHDINNFNRVSYDVLTSTVVSQSNPDYVTRNLLSSGLIKLKNTAYSENYAWVIKNGKLLTQNVDYILVKTYDAVQLTVIPSEHDIIEVLHFNTMPATPKFGFRIFKDMLDRYHYKRLDQEKIFTLVQSLNYYDKAIVLNSTVGIFVPSKAENTPGVVFIEGERIEYFKIIGNTLTQLRRGTLGTGVKSVYNIGTELMDQSLSETIQYRDKTLTQIFEADGSTNSYALDFTAKTVNEIDVYVAGTKLRKNAIKKYDFTIAQDSPEADITVAADFYLNLDTNTIDLAAIPAENQKIVVIRKIGKLWNDNGKSLLETNNSITKFLLGTTIQLPK
jgi:hypothetical protein